MSVAKSLADVLARVATASTRAGRAAPVRVRVAAAACTPVLQRVSRSAAAGSVAQLTRQRDVPRRHAGPPGCGEQDQAG